MSTIAILYPGEMGGAFAALLMAAGHKTVSPTGDRGERTRKRAEMIGVETRDSLDDAVAESDLILSLVPPSAVMDVARRTIDACRNRKVEPFFVDMNAKPPTDAECLKAAFDEASLPFCNACIIGRASHLGEEGRIYASGGNTAPLEKLFEGILPVIRLGEDVAQASIFKMAFAGFNKTIVAAVFETANTANAFGVTDSLFALIERHMAGTLADLKKLIPSYPLHIQRRAEEMEALARMLADRKLPNRIALASGATFRAIGHSGCWSGTAASASLEALLGDVEYRPGETRS